MNQVAVLDYGMGNLDSVRRALEECGARVLLTADPTDLRRADRIVLPGVGAFGVAMANLDRLGLVDALRAEAEAGAPLLGICLGMQLLATWGTEGTTSGGPPTAGLDLVGGSVTRLDRADNETRVPHVGWNEVRPNGNPNLFAEVATGSDFYFVHSFHLRPDDPDDIAATTPYAGGFVSAVSRDAVHGVQFHPEKSQQAGFALLRRFLAL